MRNLHRKFGAAALGLALIALSPSSATAAEMNGATLGLVWALPFAGILLSIALFPLIAPHFWEHHFGKYRRSGPRS
jgi:tellurite resistance protein TehA-like permease